MKNWLLHMKYCPSLSVKQLSKLWREIPKDRLRSLAPNEIAVFLEMPEERSERFKQEFYHFNLVSTMNELDNREIQLVSIEDDYYPQLLRELYDPPLLLFARGDLELLAWEKLAIVGTRKMTEYGKQILHHLVEPLCKESLVIVSGLATGIDAQAHREALEIGGKTMAVIGSGFFNFYPGENMELFEAIMKSGLVLSEYAPHVTARKWHFPERNRIISGLCLGTLIIQAEKRSGSLITADAALNQNREVFAVPGGIFGLSSAGTNKLIQEGAKLVMDAPDIMEELRQ
ncbi:DNA-protecting protein DprA [Listeria grandensis]|uniref:DNA-protecting protein DprA n=1 Tax=Listeria grandensis TaxID=1494963 RepID=A0A7X1CNM9_9LIST|nr:DNA-processing protein DprA [Listeria grandensis]MBC1473198.1 DNA-protecting protein DprA [Listeria grandensis]MBC1935155.1 DNA-protecting protein DprA [Listeria grandensis]